MSLDIFVIDENKREKAKDAFFKKYDLESYRNSDEDIVYDFLDTAAYNIQKANPNIIKWRQEMAKKLNIKVNADKRHLYNTPEEKVADLAYGAYDDLLTYGGEVDSYHIGYSTFDLFRRELAPYCGAKYYYTEHDELGRPILDSYTFQCPDEWENSDVGKSLLTFFMHSDCDGIISIRDVQNLKNYLKRHHIYDKMKEKSQAPRKEQFLDFINLIVNQPNNVYWEFY